MLLHFDFDDFKAEFDVEIKQTGERLMSDDYFKRESFCIGGKLFVKDGRLVILVINLDSHSKYLFLL